MREVEFLPGWYVQLRRRRRIIFCQVWVGVLMAGMLTGWAYRARAVEETSRQSLESLREQLLQASSELEQMARLEKLQRQWRQQVESMNRLGLHVESARLLAKLVELMPETVSLLDLSVDMEETAVPLSNIARAGLKDPSLPPVERRLRVRMQGVAPTDVELATLLTELNRVPFFDRIAPTYVKDRRQSGHILREFELTFVVNLGGAAGG